MECDDGNTILMGNVDQQALEYLMPLWFVEEVVWRISFFFFSSRRRHTRLQGDWSSDVCSSDLGPDPIALDNFRWFVDIVILLGTMFAIALSMDDNMRSGIKAAESHVLILLASSDRKSVV